jgi:hypothetical protein
MQPHAPNQSWKPSWLWALNSLSGISLNATSRPKPVMKAIMAMGSQFPFWDFVECNNRWGNPWGWTDNQGKLSIPFLGFRWMQQTIIGLVQDYISRKQPLNSLSGISLNATWIYETGADLVFTNDSQFPFWDFVECNNRWGNPWGWTDNQGKLSIPFLGFRWMQHAKKDEYEFILHSEHYYSQFPFWDFVECNRCRFGCLSGNWRGKSAGVSAYPATATALIKIRTLFKFIAGAVAPHNPRPTAHV